MATLVVLRCKAKDTNNAKQVAYVIEGRKEGRRWTREGREEVECLNYDGRVTRELGGAWPL